jgi:hypothetical protein
MRLSPLFFALAMSVVVPAHAQVGVRFEETGRAPRIDGSLRDWRGARFASLGDGDDASIEFTFRYDAAAFYLGARVLDDRVIRNARPTLTEDAIVVTFATPAGDGFRGTDIWIYPGIPGRTAAVVLAGPVGARPSPLGGARAVEGPLDGDGGYVLEASIPWRAVPGGGDWQSGRVALRLLDVDREARPVVEHTLATGDVDPRALDRLLPVEASGGSSGNLRAFLASRGIAGARPRFERNGNVAGDARPERIIVVESYVLVMGEGYRGGAQYDFFELPIATAAGVREADLLDLTGDGLADLALRLRQSNDLGSRDVYQVYRFASERIEPVFAIELRKETAGGFVEAELAIRRERGAPRIEVRAGRADGLDAGSFREAPASGIEPILLPWGPIASRVYRYDGARLAVLEERPNTRARTERPDTPREQRTERVEASRPTAPNARDLVAAFRADAGIAPNARPSFHARANVAETEVPEEVFVFDRALVVVGTGFRGGRAWFHFEIPAESAGDITSVRTADLTGDGRDEVLFRIRRRVGEVEREIVLVHQFTPNAFRRLLAVEVARRQGASAIENELRVANRALEVAPGRARSWNASNYPYADGTGDGVDTLLLPWRDRAVRYRYRDGALARE